MGLEYHRETEEERKYREDYLTKELLRRRNYNRYADTLEDYRLNFVNDPSITAAIDTENGMILINENEKFSNPNKLSMLIRHELLHSLLEHTKREIREVAIKKGIDPDKITKVEFEDILRTLNRTTDYNLRKLNGRNFGNEAGDLDLSRYYLDVDREIVKEIGGLLLDDHPEWLQKNLYFEQIIKECKKEDFLLRKRVTNKRYGDFSTDATGKKTFNLTDTRQSAFRDTDIDTSDIIGVTIPDKEICQKLNQCGILNSFGDFWIYEASEDPDYHLCLYNRRFESMPLGRNSWLSSKNIYVVLSVKNDDLYENIFKDDTPIQCTCAHEKFISIPTTNKIISATPIGQSYFNDLGQSNEYEDSKVKEIVDNWYDTHIKH